MTRRTRLTAIWTLGVIATTAALIAGARVAASRRQPPVQSAGEPVEGLTDVLGRQANGSAAALVFDDVTAEAGVMWRHGSGNRSSLIAEDMSPGVAWGDYDADGDDDLYVVGQPGPLPGSLQAFRAAGSGCRTPSGGRLFRNDGAGRFTDVTSVMEVPGRGWGMGATWADEDGDGDLDLYLTGFGCSTLYRNDGAHFTDVTDRAGVADHGFAAGVAWGDFDGDGDLDLYVAHYIQFQWTEADARRTSMQYGEAVPFTLNPSAFPPEANRLYVNLGNGTFKESAAAFGVADPNGRGLQPIFSDLDLDGDPDLYVANDVSANTLYRNDRGKFVDDSFPSWLADYRGAMGMAVADEDADGDFDIFIAHWMAQENALYRNLVKEFTAKGERDPLKFTDVADMTGLGAIALNVVGWGTGFRDFDNDGRLDLYVVNGHTLELSGGAAGDRKLTPERPFLFWHGAGDTGYFEIGERTGGLFGRPAVLRGAAAADFDGDGGVDLAVAENHGSLFLLRNATQGRGHWLEVRLKGAAPNTHAVGARVSLACGNRRLVREIAAGGSYLSMDSLTAHFGLGECASVERVEVTWSSGKMSSVAPGQIDRVLEIVEPTR